MDVALVSCRALPEPDPDAAPLAAALAAAGIDAGVAAWDDPAVDWSAARLALLRSTWNYARQLDVFLGWAARASAVCGLWNPLHVVRWNTHKGYLLALARAGLPVTPTVLLPRGSRARLAELLAEHGWDRAVVKPAVSAASFRTRRVWADRVDEGQAHLGEILRERDALVQRYLPSVEEHGERALVWIDGELTHAVRKSPRFEGQPEAVSPAAVPIAAAEAALAQRVLDLAPGPLLYARIDVAPGPDGEPLLMELELVEPSLFFAQGPVALARLVSAVRARLAAARRSGAP